MSTRAGDVDVSGLPHIAFGSRAGIWWGTVWLMAIEGTLFVLTVASTFYLMRNFQSWPPYGTPLPDLLFPTLNLALLLASCVPMAWVRRTARGGGSLQALRIGMLILVAVGLVSLVLRVYDFHALNSRWSDNSYASAIWTLVGLHTAELVAGFLENALLTWYLFARGVDANHRLDLAVNGLFWYFVVGLWVMIWIVVEITPRVM